MNFQSVVVNVSDLDQSIDFYRDVYGFTLLSRRDQLASISAPGTDRPQVLVLRALGGSGRVGARHIGMRALVQEDMSGPVRVAPSVLQKEGRERCHG